MLLLQNTDWQFRVFQSQPLLEWRSSFSDSSMAFLEKRTPSIREHDLLDCFCNNSKVCELDLDKMLVHWQIETFLKTCTARNISPFDAFASRDWRKHTQRIRWAKERKKNYNMTGLLDQHSVVLRRASKQVVELEIRQSKVSDWPLEIPTPSNLIYRLLTGSLSQRLPKWWRRRRDECPWAAAKGLVHHLSTAGLIAIGRSPLRKHCSNEASLSTLLNTFELSFLELRVLRQDVMSNFAKLLVASCGHHPALIGSHRGMTSYKFGTILQFQEENTSTTLYTFAKLPN